MAKRVGAIDRLGGVVDFNPTRAARTGSNQWVGKVDKLLDVLDKSNHLIHKEAMAHSVAGGHATARTDRAAVGKVTLSTLKN